MNTEIKTINFTSQESATSVLEQIVLKIKSNIPDNLDTEDKHCRIGQIIQQIEPNNLDFLRKLHNTFLHEMIKLKASDIELGGKTAQNCIWFRIQGSKNPYPKLGKWSLEQTDILCHCLLTLSQRKRLLEKKAADFSYHLQDNGTTHRWRASIYFDLGHLALNMRMIGSQVYPYHKLGFDPRVSRLFSLEHERQGLILLTGITGSGKSTTMDSIIDGNNRLSSAHIVIIGDPIEYIHNSHKCIIRHREVGKDVPSFKEGAIQALRQDPDIIVVGEMRDPDTIMTCLEISDTGHKVFSTLHTGSAVETIDRIVAECPAEEQDRVRVRLADQLRVIISQKLVPGPSGKLTLAKEVLVVTSAVKAAIRNKNLHEIYQMISESGKLGMITMEQDLTRLYREGLITLDTAVDFANNKKRIQELLS